MLNELENLHRLCFPARPWSAQEFADLKRSGCEIVASQNGFIVWRQILDEVELITIGVAPDARRGGVATAMLTIMESAVKKAGAKKIFLEVAEDNAGARALYAANGYTDIGRRPKYYGTTDAILMEKRI